MTSHTHANQICLFSSKEALITNKVHFSEKDSAPRDASPELSSLLADASRFVIFHHFYVNGGVFFPILRVVLHPTTPTPSPTAHSVYTASHATPAMIAPCLFQKAYSHVRTLAFSLIQRRAPCRVDLMEPSAGSRARSRCSRGAISAAVP